MELNHASEKQVRELKGVLLELEKKDSKYKNKIAEIAVMTDGFSNISKLDCEKMILEILKELESE